MTGYRYELYCASKAARTTQCTVYCAISGENAWKLNEKRQSPDTIADVDTSSLDNSSVPYTREIFDALTLRYEEPIPNNRWDSPLFTLIGDMELNKDDIFAALFEKKPPPPNQSTQNVSKYASILLNIYLWFRMIRISYAVCTLYCAHRAPKSNNK